MNKFIKFLLIFSLSSVLIFSGYTYRVYHENRASEMCVEDLRYRHVNDMDRLLEIARFYKSPDEEGHRPTYAHILAFNFYVYDMCFNRRLNENSFYR